MAKTQYLSHGFGPLWSDHSRILILGSFPSVKSREANFYYGHPQNRFWKILPAVFDDALYRSIMEDNRAYPPQTIEEKKRLVLDHNLALWDTIERCTITGSSDSSIRDVTVTDIPEILQHAPIERICCNGTTSYRLFLKYSEGNVARFCTEHGKKMPQVLQLPSTSPANAAWTLQKLLPVWKEGICTAAG